MVYTLDLKGRFTYINSAGLSLFGYQSHEILGRHFAEVLTPASARAAGEHFEGGLAGAETTPFFDVQVVRRDGAIVDIEVRERRLYRDNRLIQRQLVLRVSRAIKELHAER